MRCLSLVKVRMLNNYKHHILKENWSDNISDVVNNLVGLHSARLITPYAALIPRITNFNTESLTSELFVNHNLIKLRCMRKTLHTVTIDLAPIVHQATMKIRMPICRGLYRKIGVSIKNIEFAKELLLQLLDVSDLSSKELEYQLLHRKKIEPIITRAVIKELWEYGTICYVNKSDYWGSENRKYALTIRKYPKLLLNSVSEAKAQEDLVYFYIKSYGPVTESDISWWSGLSLSTIRICIESLGKKITSVTIKELSGKYLLTAPEIEEIYSNKYDLDLGNRLTLLAYEDPSLKGYYESRGRYIKKEFYYSLFNSIGEARSSILKNGEVIGIWGWDKRKEIISTSLFTSLEGNDQTILNELKEKTRFSLLRYKKLLKVN